MGGDLKAKYVIHTVGPVWNNGNNNEERLLQSAYKNSLKIADSYKVETIAFPNISTGIYRFPKEKAAEIAINTAYTFLLNAIFLKKITFVCFDIENYKIYEKLITHIPIEKLKLIPFLE